MLKDALSISPTEATSCSIRSWLWFYSIAAENTGRIVSVI